MASAPSIKQITVLSGLTTPILIGLDDKGQIWQGRLNINETATSFVNWAPVESRRKD